MASKKTILKSLVSDALIAIAAVVLYSPGILALRPTDASVFRAGCSILAVPVLLYVFYAVNKPLLTEKTVKTSSGQRVTFSAREGSTIDFVTDKFYLMQDAYMKREAESAVMELLKLTESLKKNPNASVKEKLPYYTSMLSSTIDKELALEEKSGKEELAKMRSEFTEIFRLLSNAFGNMNEVLSHASFTEIELDRAVLQQKIALDGLEQKVLTGEKQIDVL